MTLTVIMKFGGSCLIDKSAFNKIFEILNIYKEAKKIIVASAFNGITDLLLNTALNVNDSRILDDNMAILEKKHFNAIEQIFAEDSEHYMKAKIWVDEKLSELEDTFADIKEFGLEPYYQDYVLSFGEILSTYILNQYILSRGLDSVYIPANKLIITNDEFNNAYPFYDFTNQRVQKLLIPLLENPQKDIIICITGFIGRNKIGYTTTLGRGGSDYSATILAHSISETAKDKDIKVILWKDVDGLMAINPKFVPKSTLIRNLDYKEAKHIANFGAKILHPKCLEAIEKKNIPLELRNFDKPLEKIEFTEISEHTDKNEIKGISTVEDAVIITVASGSLVDVPGVLAKIFKVMSKNSISVSLVAQSASEISTSFIVKENESKKAVEALYNSGYFSDFFEIKSEEVAIINISGFKILENLTKAKIFQGLDKEKIHVKALTQSTEELNLSLVIDRKDVLNAINIIHDDLCEDFDQG
ncbi:MAG: aspartate kinase [Candidatus Lokiarchaeota archaeon]|nr:aspartate kinase [Candidatus Lokiarchaeota archaeon]